MIDQQIAAFLEAITMDGIGVRLSDLRHDEREHPIGGAERQVAMRLLVHLREASVDVFRMLWRDDSSGHGEIEEAEYMRRPSSRLIVRGRHDGTLWRRTRRDD